ncbi:MAG: AAA family ATPase [Cyanobacteriota bacterium]|nr:AAA family ATPase [Cyanobacteriota bacterium]
MATATKPRTPKNKLTEVEWSHYQQAIFDWATHGSGHALVNAVAGSGKTQTLRGLVSRIPSDKKVAVLAFNNHMAAELESKLPKRITVSTIHRMGMFMLTRYFRSTFQCNEAKYHDLATAAVDQLRPNFASIPSKELKAVERECRGFLKQILHYLQITLTDPTEENIHHLIQHFGLETPEDPSLLELLLPLPAKLLDQGKALGIDQQNVGLDDLLWLPHVLNLQPVQKEWVLIDEAQDLSRAQLELVLKLPSSTGRMVFVGDPNQAIFGFAGSDDQSWERIREAIHPKEFPLSITYRCPGSHVRLASRLVPQIEARPNALTGQISVIHPTRIKHEVNVGDLVICRFMAPLIALCLKLVIHSRIPAKVRGRDLGKMLISLTKDVADHFPQNFLSELRNHVAAKVEIYQRNGKESAIESIHDRSLALESCFEAFGLKCGTVQDFCQRIEGLFDDDAPLANHVILATIHRAKGDEAERVFLLKSDSMPATFLASTSWQSQQELHLLYVALTRSKGSLFLVPMPKKADLMDVLLTDPLGGIQFPKSPLSVPTVSAPSVTPESTPMGEQISAILSDFESEVNALHQSIRRMLLEFVEVAQAWQGEFPDPMEMVWHRLGSELKGVNWGIPIHFRLEQPEAKSRSPARVIPLLRVGDICRYVGSDGPMRVTCRGRDLKVLGVKGSVATVTALKDYFHHHEWIRPYDIEMQHLRRKS